MEKQIIDYKKIGGRIKGTRQQKGITGEKLSEKIGISSMHLGQLEQGERRGGINNYIEIAKCFRIIVRFFVFQ